MKVEMAVTGRVTAMGRPLPSTSAVLIQSSSRPGLMPSGFASLSMTVALGFLKPRSMTLT